MSDANAQIGTPLVTPCGRCGAPCVPEYGTKLCSACAVKAQEQPHLGARRDPLKH
jgi:hypothetical protein